MPSFIITSEGLVNLNHVEQITYGAADQIITFWFASVTEAFAPSLVIRGREASTLDRFLRGLSIDPSRPALANPPTSI